MLNLQFRSASFFFHLAFENKHFPVLLQTLGKHHFNRCTTFHPVAAPHGLFKISTHTPPVGLVDIFFSLFGFFFYQNKTSFVFLFLSIWGLHQYLQEKPSLGRVQNSRVVC